MYVCFYSEKTIREGMMDPRQCWGVLEKAKKDFLIVIGKILKDDTAQLEVNERLLVGQYLMAILILKNLQRPGVAKNMTVSISLCHSCSFHVVTT